MASAGHGNGIYVVDENGEPCDNAIMSTDGRARDIIDEWTAAGVAETVLPKSMQAIWPAQPGALLLWYKRNKPEVLDKAAHVLMAKDYEFLTKKRRPVHPPLYNQRDVLRSLEHFVTVARGRRLPILQ